MSEFKPKVIPARQPGWEHAYAVTLQRLAETPFHWGTADCMTRVADMCFAITGVNPFPASSRRYRTAAGATRQLARLGFDDVDAALSAQFPEVPRLKARRGDCGVGQVRVAGEWVVAAFIVMGANAVGANEKGPVIVPTVKLRKTFAIGWRPPV